MSLLAGALVAAALACPTVAATGGLVTVSAPSGSTPVLGSDGTVSYDLPPGAVAEKFTLATPAPTDSTTSSAVYPGDPSLAVLRPAAGRDRSHSLPSSSSTPAALNEPFCVVAADDPTAPGGGVIEGVAEIGCSVPAEVSITATLYWWSGSKWVWQSSNTNSGTSYAQVADFHGCTIGQTHEWHTRGDGTADYEGLLYSFEPVNSFNEKLKCK